MYLARLKKIKELLDQKKEILKDFYSSREFYEALAEIRTKVKDENYLVLESKDISSPLEHAIDSLFLVKRPDVFRKYNQKLPSFHLIFEDLVFSKFYQEKLLYSVESKSTFLGKKGDLNENLLN